MPKGKEEQYYDWPTNDARGRYEDGWEFKEYKKGGFFSKKNVKNVKKNVKNVKKKDKR